MKKFWGYTSNGRFSVGCTGQTVYLFDENGKEIKKFKDITYGYTPMISPDGKTFIVKSTDGRLAIYSLETFSLIKKFRFSKVNGAQDDGFCFSPDGKEFYNIERHIDSCKTALSIYNTGDFSLKKRLLEKINMVLEVIEYDDFTASYYLMGFFRGEAGGVANKYFIGRLNNDDLENLVYISEKENWFYRLYSNLKIKGFTEKAYEWSYIDYELDVIKSMNCSLVKIFNTYNINR